MTHSGNERSFYIAPLPFVTSPRPDLSVRGEAFLARINKDIRQLNLLISEYNATSDRTEQIAKLKQLDISRQRLDDTYPDQELSHFPDYHTAIYTALQEALYQQRSLLHLGSNYQKIAIFEPDLGQELSDVLDGLSTEEVGQIMQVLAQGKGKAKSIHQKLTQIAPMNLAYQTFLIQNDVDFVKGGNSKNCAFVNRQHQTRILLKLENRLNSPKKEERELRNLLNEQTPDDNFLVREWSDRRAAYTDPKTNKVIIRRLIVMDCSPGRTISDLPLETDVPAQQNLAIDTALAQIMIYKKMHLLGKTWTDGKGDNLLLHRDPQTQKMVAEIADCKAIYPCDAANGTADFQAPVVITPRWSAPELLAHKPGVIHTGKAAVYTIGRNLFESLLSFAPTAYQRYLTPRADGTCPCDVEEFPDQYFNHPVFDGPFKELIQSMVVSDAAARISDDELFLKLLDIKFAQHPQFAEYQHISQNLKRILEFDLPTEEKLQRNEYVYKCYQSLMVTQPDFTKLDQRLNRVVQRYEARSVTTIYKGALDSQKKAGLDESNSKELDI